MPSVHVRARVPQSESSEQALPWSGEGGGGGPPGESAVQRMDLAGPRRSRDPGRSVVGGCATERFLGDLSI